MSSEIFYRVAVTAIIERDGRYLIMKRPLSKKRWPGRWTVPGGRLDSADYQNVPYDSESEWFHILERVVKREVKEEVNLDIDGVDYVKSVLVDHGEKEVPTLVISFAAQSALGEVAASEEEVDAIAWVTLEEAKGYDLVGDIYGELVTVEECRTKA